MTPRGPCWDSGGMGTGGIRNLVWWFHRRERRNAKTPRGPQKGTHPIVAAGSARSGPVDSSAGTPKCSPPGARNGPCNV
jgi:hypothetical protein